MFEADLSKWFLGKDSKEQLLKKFNEKTRGPGNSTERNVRNDLLVNFVVEKKAHLACQVITLPTEFYAFCIGALRPALSMVQRWSGDRPAD